MQFCRICGKGIPTGRPYDPGELWICNACIEKQQIIYDENIRRAIQDGIERKEVKINGDNHCRNYKINNKQAIVTAQDGRDIEIRD